MIRNTDPKSKRNYQLSYKKLVSVLGENRVVLDEPLSRYSSFKLGGPCDLMYKAKTADELAEAVSLAIDYQIPLFILGGGTNLLIADSGFRGLVVKNETARIRLLGIKGGTKNQNRKLQTKIHTVYLEAESGVGVNRLVRYTLDQGISGLEPFLGQPGTIGGALWINAHNMKMGRFFGDSVYSVTLIDNKGKLKKVPQKYFGFSYDQSVLQKTKEVVVSAVFQLTIGDKDSLWKTAQKVMEYRRDTQPHGVYSSGCTFRNISQSDAIRLVTPNYTQSVGFLLDSLGLKGKRKGGAMFSPQHANFIIHTGSATASDVLELINLAKNKIWEKYAVKLEEEIILVGEFNHG